MVRVETFSELLKMGRNYEKFYFIQKYSSGQSCLERRIDKQDIVCLERKDFVKCSLFLMVELLNSHSGLLTRLINFGVVLES